ncbi:helix-turn-helix domain-containing protein [Amycolatopsis sp. NPDC023774]|uniref:helix-turn-helix domain-containing protein n=1 Tax=Amycolatopsis sp. NPDC023774 TaxID=3155015 RepID=UPI00340178A5
MEIENSGDRAHGCAAVAAAIREVAAAVRAAAPAPPADPDALLTAEDVGELLQLSPRTLKDQAAAGVLQHHRFGKHNRFTRGDVAEIVRLSAAPAKPARRRVSLGDLAQYWFPAKKAAEDRGLEQEAQIRRNLWLDPRDGETRFGDFAEEWLEAVSPRLELTTVAKYRPFLDNQLLPQWKAWSLVAIFNGYVEVERWLSKLHQDYAEALVSSYFALFSTILNGAVRARMIPANPCSGVRVTSGEFDTEGWSLVRLRRCGPRCGSTRWAWECRGSCCV